MEAQRKKPTPEEQQARLVAELKVRINKEFIAACSEIIPERWKDIRPSQLQVSDKSRLLPEEQTKLYAEINDPVKKLEGWAFFAPAGFGKTTVSWALYKYALLENLKRALWTGKREFLRMGAMDSPRLRTWSPCYCWAVSLPEWIAQTQKSWNDPNTAPPALSYDKIAKARRDGFVPRVFIAEIDKVKTGSEWNTNELFLLLDAIDKHKGQLVIDTNLSRQQFMDRFGEPIYRRVKQNCNMREWGF